jgi:hypothetical protein
LDTPRLGSFRPRSSPWRADRAKRGFQAAYKVNPLGPNPGLVIALHSPSALPETGLPMCPQEKGRQINAIRSRVVHSLQSALRAKYYQIRACLAYFAAKAGHFLYSLDLLAERETCRIAAIFNDSCSNAALFLCNPDCVAEGEGFEPPVPFQVQRFSRPPVSTTHASLRVVRATSCSLAGAICCTAC